ncbi:MAG TPA: TRAM domain-containing protein, partial [Bacteroidota bacterium]|nr:TRAM domain-containing protein [Bacteroidota bacterium]
MTYGGDAIGRLDDGRAVFIPFGLPGERVRVRLTEEKRGFARGELVKVLDASPERIIPRCRHFGQCGGCHYQHMPYEMQLKVKADTLRDQLQRIGRIENPPVRPTVAGPSPWNYRNHIQFHLNDNAELGFQASASNQVIPISECYLPETAIHSLWKQLEFEADSGIKRLSLRSGTDDDLMLILESDSHETPEIEIEADISVVHIFEGHAVVLAGNDHITIKVLDREFHISSNSFFQVNTSMAEKMVSHLLDRLTISQATMLDVYCGVGLFSAFLAPMCNRLIGIESSPSACDDFTINLDQFNNVELYEDLAENVLPALKVEPTFILVDPPRA